ncbi:MAG: hypothetical protein O2798_08075 [Chloroflexi bacterium]|nr:hypothetical protein [Chloroflexota bacterium]MDA1240779.1 hypothetical protein [Chloroflexota bacterium]
MARYLLVAHQTATDPLVLRRAKDLLAGDPAAAFTILVPETHVEHPLVCDEVATREAARTRAREAATMLRRAGIQVLRVETGDTNPLRAIQDELLFHPNEHDAVILSTFPPGVSRWLRMDLATRLGAQHLLPVFHVYEGGEVTWDESAVLRRQVAQRVSPMIEASRSPVSRITRSIGRIPFAPAFAVLLTIHIVLVTGLALQYDLRFLRVEAIMLVLMVAVLISTGVIGSSRLVPKRLRRPM